MAEDPIRFEVEGHVAIITLDRPEARNAISVRLANAMEAAIDEIEATTAIRAAVICANIEGQANPVFCAGADLKDVAANGNPRTDRGHFAGFVYRERSKPFIAAVDGMALAGGCEIALACDIVVASTRSSFAMPEVKRNLFAGAGAMSRLPAAVGKATAMDMLLTAEPLPAARAYQLGLISRLVAPDQVKAAALAVAGRIAENAPIAVQWTRRAVEAAGRLDHAASLAFDKNASLACRTSEDSEEGLRAFMEKRAPVWKGR